MFLEIVGASLLRTQKEPAYPGAKESCFVLVKVLLQR